MGVCFSRKRDIIRDQHLSLNSNPIPVKKKHKVLGLVYDSKLTFGPHMKELEQNVKGRLISLGRYHTSHGDRTVLAYSESITLW